jgi:geranylgeranyl diphosphate synthase, type I
VSQPIKLHDLVDQRISSFLDAREAEMEIISPDLAHLVDYTRVLLANGKRFRARFCYWGWRAIHSLPEDSDPLGGVEKIDDLDAVLALAVSLEIFHAAALVHDDIMDNSDTRRGKPSAHRSFEIFHKERGFSGSHQHFGLSTALLVGDLLLAWSDQLLSSALRHDMSASAEAETRAQFARMRQEVTLGQYLDIHEEAAWPHTPDHERMDRALRVVTYKSAKYSMEAPLLIGASLAGATAAHRAALSEFGLPLGIAFQLRDDVLGVFGDSEITGKPSGDDLREGKRTVLIALAEQAMPATTKRLFQEMLGEPTLDGDQIGVMQSTLRDTGALDSVEEMIESYVHQAMGALEGAPIAAGAKQELGRLAEVVTQRHA